MKETLLIGFSKPFFVLSLVFLGIFSILVAQDPKERVPSSNILPSPVDSTNSTEGLPAIPSANYTFPKAKYFGVSSCATQGCHGAEQTKSTKGKEFRIWCEGDPHFKAYQILFNDQSKSIAKILNQSRPKNERVEAHQDHICLRCHAVPGIKLDRTEIEFGTQNRILHNDAVLADGVSCEACHGPAEHWLSAHYQRGWKEKSLQEKASFGMYPTKDLAFRITMCTTCHVGQTAGEDVDHILYAAGHPPLFFEYTRSDHQSNYIKHWSESSYGNDYDVRAYAIGQIATLQAQVALLGSRATNRLQNDNQAWPEFAEFSCYGCHQTLKPANDFSAPNTAKLFSWATWPRATIDIIQKNHPLFSNSPSPQLSAYHQLCRAMEPSIQSKNGGRINFPDPKSISELSRKTVEELEIWKNDLQRQAFGDAHHRTIPAASVEKLLRDLVAHQITNNNGGKLTNTHWESAAQHQLGISSMIYSLAILDRKMVKPDWITAIQEMNRNLNFSSGYYSPTQYDPNKLFQQLNQLQKKLK